MSAAVFLPRAVRPHRLAWPRTLPFQGSNTGSNPVGDTTLFRAKATSTLPDHACLFRNAEQADETRLLLQTGDLPQPLIKAGRFYWKPLTRINVPIGRLASSHMV